MGPPGAGAFSPSVGGRLRPQRLEETLGNVLISVVPWSERAGNSDEDPCVLGKASSLGPLGCLL